MALELGQLLDTVTGCLSPAPTLPLLDEDLLHTEVALPLDHQDGDGVFCPPLLHQAGNSHELKCRGIDKSKRDKECWL